MEFLDEMVATGAESAVQVAVYKDGELVVDACAGPVDAGSLFHAASAAKGIAATVAHVLVERGELAYDTRIADVEAVKAVLAPTGVPLVGAVVLRQ